MSIYYRNQSLAAKGINGIIDKYWKNEKTEEEMINEIKDLVSKNYSLVYKGNDYSAVIKQRVGKKRMRVMNQVLNRDIEVD